MNAAKLKQTLVAAFKNKRNVLIKGQPGVGKTDIVKQVVAELGYEILIGHPVVSDPTDYKGLPSLTKSGEAQFLPFGDLVRLIEADKPLVCFQDDIGQSAIAVQAALMQVWWERSINGKKISDHVIFCGATNDTKDMAGVTGLIEPFKSRNTILTLEPSLDDWCEWALQNSMPSNLVAFIRFRPKLLSDFKPTREIRNSPCPRTWASVGAWYNQGVRDVEVWSGDIGEGTATEFSAFNDMASKLPSLDAILLNPEKSPVPKEASLNYAVSCGLANKINEANFGRALVYLARLPKEFEVMSVRDALKMNHKLSQSKEFVKWAVANKEVFI